MAELILYGIEALVLIWFITAINKKALFKSALFYVFAVALFGINVFVGMFSKEKIVLIVINTVILLAYSILSGGRGWKLTAPLVGVGMTSLLSYLSLKMYSFLLHQPWEEVVEKGSATRIVALYSAFVLSVFLLMNVAEFSSRKQRRFQEYFLLVISPLMILAILLITLAFSSFSPMHRYRYLFVIACLLALLIYGGIYYLVYKVTENMKNEAEKKLYQQMLEYEKRRYSDISAVELRIGKIKHDIKNQLNVVALQLSQKDYEGAQKTLSELSLNVNSTGTIINSGNSIADYIINTKLGKLKNAVIIVTGDSKILDFVDKLDVSIMLGCMIDNVVDAVEKQQRAHVEISFFEKANHVNIICKNSIVESVLKENPELETTKEEKEEHGFGIKSVYEVAEKYKGAVSVYEENDMFCIHVLLPELL